MVPSVKLAVTRPSSPIETSDSFAEAMPSWSIEAMLNAPAACLVVVPKSSVSAIGDEAPDGKTLLNATGAVGEVIAPAASKVSCGRLRASPSWRRSRPPRCR